VFRFKEHVVEVFEGWGILGTILLAESNFGLVSLILLIVFFVAVFNVFKPGKLFSFSKGDLVSDGPVAREIDREIAVENQEREMVAEGAEKMTRIEKGVSRSPRSVRETEGGGQHGILHPAPYLSRESRRERHQPSYVPPDSLQRFSHCSPAMSLT
jgi:hypothetical protein